MARVYLNYSNNAFVIKSEINVLNSEFNLSVAVRWQGKTRGAIGFSLIFLFLFSSRKKEKKFVRSMQTILKPEFKLLPVGSGLSRLGIRV